MGTTSQTTCAIAGAGPAGLVLGLLLARVGVEVTVLEKHADFLRDFRGDTVHPTTMALLEDLGLFERFNALPQSHITHVTLPGGDGRGVTVADFRRLRLRHPYIAMVPQWDLLNLLAEAAAEEPSFTLLTEHEVTGVVHDGGRVIGVEYSTPSGSGRLLADLAVACDGRWSAVRRALDLPVTEIPVGFDVWWFKVPTTSDVGESLLPRAKNGRVAIAIPRRGYLQVALIGPKGTDHAVRSTDIETFRTEIADLIPDIAADVFEIPSMDDVKHLDVRVDRLRRWHRLGVLCIGDAAHAMSPVGGVGINLAVQDAVAAARVLAAPLASGALKATCSERLLARVHRRRVVPTVAIQGLQRIMHARIIMPALAGMNFQPPASLACLLRRLPFLSSIPALVIGVGPRPERAPQWARRAPRVRKARAMSVKR
ncbi:FAD-dependent oxidoreductase [Brevibacterium sp. Re57]|uniref:FAD-dependent oxidoreductase n=1 Tax=Brevibacterium gallinarum TaxID=2762220 RepID=A0ABR8WVW9_9MICO|nr:FAD-dependent oxidoreductase [Brevibacterium gallinarum]